MAYQHGRAGGAAQLASGANTLKTFDVTTTNLDLVLTNTSGSPVTVVINKVPSGGSVANLSEIVPTKDILAGKTYICNELRGQTMAAGDSIRVDSSAATSISWFLSYIEVA